MAIHLTNDNIKSIQDVVNHVNQYFRDIWQTYEMVMVVERRNYKHNSVKFSRMNRIVANNYQHDQVQNIYNASSFLADPELNYGTSSPDDDMIIQSTLDFQRACNRKRSLWAQGYRNYLLGMLYHCLYKDYGKSIPNGLDHFIDYRLIYQDSGHVFGDLEKWWDSSVGKRSIRDYTQSENRIQKRRRQIQFIKDSKQRMNWLVADNDFRQDDEQNVRVIKGCDDNGYDGSKKYDLGSKSINALFFWITRYRSLSVRPNVIPYRQHSFQRGTNRMTDSPIVRRIYLRKDGSFSITFRSKTWAKQVIKSLESYRYTILHSYYRRQIDHISQNVQDKLRAALQDAQRVGLLVNYHLDLDFSNSPRNKKNILFLLQKIFDRYQRELARPDTPYYLKAPQGLTDIEEYWRGMKMTLNTFDYEPIRLMQIELDDAPMLRNITTDANKEYRILHCNLNNKSYYCSSGMFKAIKIIQHKLYLAQNSATINS